MMNSVLIVQLTNYPVIHTQLGKYPMNVKLETALDWPSVD